MSLLRKETTGFALRLPVQREGRQSYWRPKGQDERAGIGSSFGPMGALAC